MTIIDYLEELFPNPKSELIYHKDYELLISVMLSAQTTDKRVNEVTKKLYSKYNSLLKLSKARVDDIIDIIKPLGTYHKKAQNVIAISKRLLEDSNGVVINDREFLESLPGVGRKTANVVLALLFNEPFIAVDTHVKRVSIRLGIASESDSLITIEKKLYQKFENDKAINIHHQLLLFGRYYCKARNPLCHDCKIRDICKYKKRYSDVKK